MRRVTASAKQTVWDIALQSMGSVESIFEILALNPGLSLDADFKQGTVVFVPDLATKATVVNYYSENNICPATGNISDLIEYTNEDNGMIIRDYNYNLAGGANTFDGVRLFNLNKDVTIQINYTAINTGVKVYIESSLDGVNYSPIPDADYTLDASSLNHQFMIIGLTTSYIRLRIENAVSGTIDKMIIEL